MNKRQKKKAATGKSPRLLERLLGMPRGSCVDAIIVDQDRARSYSGVRFKPAGLYVVPKSTEYHAVAVTLDGRTLVVEVLPGETEAAATERARKRIERGEGEPATGYIAGREGP